jgi:hypothetical protein
MLLVDQSYGIHMGYLYVCLSHLPYIKELTLHNSCSNWMKSTYLTSWLFMRRLSSYYKIQARQMASLGLKTRQTMVCAEAHVNLIHDTHAWPQVYHWPSYLYNCFSISPSSSMYFTEYDKQHVNQMQTCSICLPCEVWRKDGVWPCPVTLWRPHRGVLCHRKPSYLPMEELNN